MHRSESVVVDTNVALDLLLFADPAAARLAQALSDGRLHWCASLAMREELSRVLSYPHLARRLHRQAREAADVLADFDRRVQVVAPAPRASFVCKDPDDQKFIDLAAAHRALLLSKDAQVLCMARRLSRLGVRVVRHWDGA
ncbi:MAG TPA: putative toxin-antitoxin system toxin component, PIN family [Hydrogenophaga sp.]|uniref:putative toxin-antitoxin system toxin component, PIN family n=1 Tax=Hydrogenophaga sp. TaxID=1904254 RepID=UPI002D04790D|nr:putative toxin-antitoxin system toxin component, PIN family [Hydrogenophaga sp.]HMN92877.1 putative toxin-antitoxin system toxin component, PIN family [Hydrogenophaga sp.]HMP10904.1 putative toxin-antitoxin system toxin component, PIN family [Hydrogenophaga sp.]